MVRINMSDDASLNDVEAYTRWNAFFEHIFQNMISEGMYHAHKLHCDEIRMSNTLWLKLQYDTCGYICGNIYCFLMTKWHIWHDRKWRVDIYTLFKANKDLEIFVTILFKYELYYIDLEHIV